MKEVKYYIGEEDITLVLSHILKDLSVPAHFTTISIMTGSGGLETLVSGCKSRSEKIITFENGEGREFKVDAVYSSVMDSSLVDPRNYKGYPQTSYKMFVFNGGRAIAEINPRFPQKTSK